MDQLNLEQLNLKTWLKQSLITAKYQYIDRVLRDVEETRLLYKTLIPKFEAYICLHGTIPITYRSNPYYIQVAFWIPTEYPHSPPIVFVVPTSNMLIKKGIHVDPNGRCNHPYLEFWQSRSEESTISKLCTILQSIFSQNPPLYTKPNINNNPSVRSSQPLSPPERPIQSHIVPPSAHNPFPSRSPTPPPLPPPPPYQSINQNVEINRPISQSGTTNSPINTSFSMPPQSLLRGSVVVPLQSSPPSHQIPSILDTPPPPINSQPPARVINNQSPEIVKLQVDIYEKIERDWSYYHENATLEINKMMSLSEQLNNSEKQIEKEKKQLIELQNQLQEKIDYIKAKSSEVDRLIEQASNIPEISVDDVLCGTTIVYNQLSN
ncbi:12838_t:CDS:2 [Ambispora gerdemannii]|uniref:12838_t:CDS:1 n=1 Tax=Ambispora gerdemannii TaxID=144530 RepID=A0A9N9BCT3_9GLOM|nr:12838_t:CDS:2 [Ambispora gerdemannii]